MWLVVNVETSDASNSLPTPLPGRAASLQMMESSDFFCRTNSWTRRSGVPIPMKPPIMILAPLGIMATACSAETAFIESFPILVWTPAIEAERRKVGY